jgi:hypothetical protein
LPLKVKPTRQQIAATKAAQNQKNYLLGIKNKPAAQMVTGTPNRFQALESAAHIEEVAKPKPVANDPIVPIADFQQREAIVFFDSERLPPFSLVHLKLTRGLDADESTKVIKELGRDWAVCTTELDPDLKDRIRYAHLQGWPLTKADTCMWIQEEADRRQCDVTEIARSIGSDSVDDAGPHDYYQHRTNQVDRNSGIFFMRFPELTSAAALDHYISNEGKLFRVQYLRATDIGLGGCGDGPALEEHWLSKEYEALPALHGTFLNWFLAEHESQEHKRTSAIIFRLTDLIYTESVRLAYLSTNGPAISYEAAHLMAMRLFRENCTTVEDCHLLARENTPFLTPTINPPHATVNV